MVAKQQGIPFSQSRGMTAMVLRTSGGIDLFGGLSQLFPTTLGGPSWAIRPTHKRERLCE